MNRFERRQIYQKRECWCREIKDEKRKKARGHKTYPALSSIDLFDSFRRQPVKNAERNKASAYHSERKNKVDDCSFRKDCCYR